MKLLAANLVFGGTAFIFNVLGCIWGWQLFFEHRVARNKGGGGGSYGSGAPSGWYDV